MFKTLSVERWTLSVQRFSLLFLLLILAPAVASAQSPVSWQVDSSCAFLDWDEDGAADHCRCTYLVSNISPLGDANNLISITLFAGTDQGVFSVGFVPTGWLADIQTDRTVFSSNGNYLPPRGEATFYLYSRYTGTAPGAAEAASEANGPFPALTVILPAPRPASLAAARLSAEPGGTNSLSISVISPDAHSFLLQYTESLSPTNWTDLARVAVTGAVTVATDTNAAPSRFYRALVP